MWINGSNILMGAACGQMRLYYLYLLVMSHTWRGAGGRGVYLLVFTWYLYWRIWSLLQLSAVSPGKAIIQLLSHQLPVTTSTRTQGHEHNQQQCRDPWLHFAIRFQPNWSEVIQLEGEVLQFCWKRNNLQSLKNVRPAGCVEVEQTSTRA